MKHFIPIVNDVENLLPKALEGCKALWNRTIIIDNRDTEKEKEIDLSKIVDPSIEIYKPIVPFTTAQSMNLMLELSKDQEFFTWQHLDAVCLEDTATRLYEIVEELLKNTVKWGVVFTNYDTYAAYNVKALKEIGGWDWKRFPYYFLDNDIHHRLINLNYKLVRTNLPVFHKALRCGLSVADCQRHHPQRVFG